MALPDVPHLAFPLRLDPATGSMAANEQDTLNDIHDCVHAIVRCHPGSLPDAPTFGITDPTFGELPVDTDRLVEEIGDLEPRARLLAEQDPERFDELTAAIRLGVAEPAE